MFVLLGHERINVKLTVDCWITHDALGNTIWARSRSRVGIVKIQSRCKRYSVRECDYPGDVPTSGDVLHCIPICMATAVTEQ